jgi:hypothetical protein
MTKISDIQDRDRKTGQFGPAFVRPPAITLNADSTVSASNYDMSTTVDDVTRYTRDGVLHRMNGLAVERLNPTNYTGEYWVDGVRVTEPDDSQDFDLVDVTDDGTQTWQSAGGNRTVTVHVDGTREFYRDGDLDRAGAPALEEPGTKGRWFRGGTEMPCPWPDLPTVTANQSADTITTEGQHFIAGRPAKEIAADLRKAIAAGTRAGILDDLGITYTVKVHPNSKEDRPTIHVTVTGLTNDRIIRAHEPNDQPFHSDEALAITSALERLGQAYNKTTVHNGTDSIQSLFWFNTSLSRG